MANLKAAFLKKLGERVYIWSHAKICRWGKDSNGNEITVYEKINQVNGDLSERIDTTNASLSSKISTSAIKNNLTTTTFGGVLDARQGKALNDNISVESVNASVSLEQLNERCGAGKKKTFFYAAVPTLPSALTGVSYLYVTLYKSSIGFTVCDAFGIIGNTGKIAHAYGYYEATTLIWTSK